MKPFVIGISGGSGSGKSTLVSELVYKISSSNVSVLSQDSYYIDQSHLPAEERDQINFDHPAAFDNDLLVKHLRQLIAGKAVDVPVYNFSTHTRQSFTRPIYPSTILLIEGIYILYHEEINKLLDYKIFIDLDDDERFIRRLIRDVEERGRSMDSVIKQYLTTVKPMHNKYIAPSKKNADIIISGNNGIEYLTELLAQKLL